MLTNHILSWYNHLLATSLIYFSLKDPIYELSRSLEFQKVGDQFAIFSVALAEAAQDYYEILGVKKDATKHEIHKAFRQLAKKYHPDKNKEKGAQDEFIKIFKAYEALSDEKKRKEYDNRSTNQNGAFANGWQNGMNDGFDMHDFFRQYEDQLFRHAQNLNEHNHHHNHHYNHHHNHHYNHHHGDKFMFHGVNLDDLFHDIDEDEFSKLFDFAGHQQQHYAHHQNHRHYHDQTYDDDGTFGDGASFFGSHFPSQVLDTLHQYQQHHSFHSSDKKSSSYSCQTITKQVNGMVMTQTSCG